MPSIKQLTPQLVKITRLEAMMISLKAPALRQTEESSTWRFIRMQPEANEANRANFHMAMALEGRSCVFVTTQKQLRIAPGDIHEGDEVYLVPGMRLPVVVRKTGTGEYRLISAGYIHGVTKGDMWDTNRHALAELRLR
jgi:hypothetical protein